MAEALGVVSSTLQIADVLFRVGKYLNEVYREAKVIDIHTQNLVSEIEALRSVVASVQETFKTEIAAQTSSTTLVDNDSLDPLWWKVSVSLKSCLKEVLSLEVELKEICGTGGQSSSGKLDRVARARRKKSKEPNLQQCRGIIETYQRNLHILLTTINLKSGRSLQQETSESFDKLSKDLQNIHNDVQSGILSIRSDPFSHDGYEARLNAATLTAYNDLKLSVESATVAVKAVSSNEYFDIPVPVRSIFTGRKKHLKDMKEFFIAPLGPTRNAEQRRFVVSGIGGSGKTQFCCKFAEQNRDCFWGIFWLDGSSEERIKQTLTPIASIAKVEPNINAVLYWLGNIKQRWLLIIDNADDSDMSLEQYFPTGNRGHILITTRTQSFKIHGNVGPGSYDFERLDLREANQLLLKAAGRSDFQNLGLVSTITKALSFLALAIIQAGAAIRKKLCTFEDYIAFSERSWGMSRNVSRTDAQEEKSPVLLVYKTWEANYKYLETHPSRSREDAIDLLKIFAFFHREKISFQTFARAVTINAIEKKTEQKTRDLPKKTPAEGRISWFRTLKLLYHFGPTADTSPPLPRLIQDGRKEEDNELYLFRLRAALAELEEYSLISRGTMKDSFYMHPLQHRYARERLGLAEQGLWAEIASMILAASILLPPLGKKPEHEAYNKQLVPHIDHVLKCRENIDTQLSKKRKESWSNMLHPSSPPLSSFNRNRASMYAKFSVVYMQHGSYDTAQRLQRPVRDFLLTFLGPEDPKSRLITTALSKTLWVLGRPGDAATLQREVLAICEKSFGHDHVETLRAKRELVLTIFQQGHYTKTKEMQAEIVQGFEKTLGHTAEETLKANAFLAVMIAKFWTAQDFELAIRLLQDTIKALENSLNSDDEDLLVAKEDLARMWVDSGAEHFEAGEALITEVFERRTRILGKEHPYTLLAMINTALIKSVKGVPHEAEELLRAGLEIAYRNLEKDHVGVLLGRVYLGGTLTQQSRYGEAEEILLDATERLKNIQSQREYHPDRVAALVELAKCYRLQGKIELAIQTCDEAIDGFEKIGVSSHPLALDLKAARKRLVRYQDATENEEIVLDDVTKPKPGRYHHWHVF